MNEAPEFFSNTISSMKTPLTNVLNLQKCKTQSEVTYKQVPGSFFKYGELHSICRRDLNRIWDDF